MHSAKAPSRVGTPDERRSQRKRARWSPSATVWTPFCPPRMDAFEKHVVPTEDKHAALLSLRRRMWCAIEDGDCERAREIVGRRHFAATPAILDAMLKAGFVLALDEYLDGRPREEKEIFPDMMQYVEPGFVWLACRALERGGACLVEMLMAKPYNSQLLDCALEHGLVTRRDMRHGFMKVVADGDEEAMDALFRYDESTEQREAMLVRGLVEAAYWQCGLSHKALPKSLAKLGACHMNHARADRVVKHEWPHGVPGLSDDELHAFLLAVLPRPGAQ